MTDNTNDFGTFEFDGHSYKLQKDIAKTSRVLAVRELFINGQEEAGIVAIMKRVFTADDFAVLAEYDIEELYPAFGEYIEDTVGVDAGN